MKAETFVKIAIGAAASTLLAILVHWSSNPWSQGTIAGSKLVPSLASGTASAGAIAIMQGGATMTLEGKDKVWTLKERSGYPADPEKVRALVLKLSQAELIEAKTKKPDRHAMLQLEDPKAKDAKSRGVRVLDAKGGVIADLVIGKRRWDAFGSGKGGTYVRSANDPQTWLATGEIDASSDVKSWIKPNVLDVEEGKISRLTIAMPGEEPLGVERGAEPGAKPAFAGFPGEGKKLKDASAAAALLRAAAAIEADDVRKIAATPAGEGVSTVTLATHDGLEVVLRLRKDADGNWLSISATGKGDSAVKADAIKTATSSWEFKIPAAKTEALLKRRADLVEGS